MFARANELGHLKTDRFHTTVLLIRQSCSSSSSAAWTDSDANYSSVAYTWCSYVARQVRTRTVPLRASAIATTGIVALSLTVLERTSAEDRRSAGTDAPSQRNRSACADALLESLGQIGRPPEKGWIMTGISEFHDRVDIPRATVEISTGREQTAR